MVVQTHARRHRDLPLVLQRAQVHPKHPHSRATRTRAMPPNCGTRKRGATVSRGAAEHLCAVRAAVGAWAGFGQPLAPLRRPFAVHPFAAQQRPTVPLQRSQSLAPSNSAGRARGQFMAIE